MLANEITLDRVEVPVGLLRSQDQIVAEINALGAKAKQASDKADQYRATRRQNISELHKRWPDEWLQIVKEQCNIGERQAYRQLALADGRTTEQKEREKRQSTDTVSVKNTENIEESDDDAEDTLENMAATTGSAQAAPNAVPSAAGKSATVVFDGWRCSDEEKAQAYAFLERAETALAAADYPEGILTPRVLEKVSAVAVAWTKLSKELHEEYAELNEQQAAGE